MMPLLHEVLVAQLAGLNVALRILGSGPCRPWMGFSEDREVRFVHVLRLLRQHCAQLDEAASSVFVATHVTNLRYGILIGHGQVQDIRRRRHRR